MEEEKEIENEFAKIYYKDGIIIGVFKNVIIDLEAAKAIVADRKKISGYKKSPILVDARVTQKLTKEARDYFGSDEGADLLSATVLIGSSMLSSFIMNFLIKVNFKKADFPMRVYSDSSKGEDWLRTFL